MRQVASWLCVVKDFFPHTVNGVSPDLRQWAIVYYYAVCRQSTGPLGG